MAHSFRESIRRVWPLVAASKGTTRCEGRRGQRRRVLEHRRCEGAIARQAHELSVAACRRTIQRMSTVPLHVASRWCFASNVAWWLAADHMANPDKAIVR